jgi:hypothetical protein
MTKEEALNILSDKNSDINIVKEIFYNFIYDKELINGVAINLSLKSSVYDSEMGKSIIMTELLEKLSDYDDMSCRWAVAKNRHTSSNILKKLATDKINLVRALVATNPNTPKESLTQLFNDEKIVRDGLSGNPSTPIKFLRVLADDRDKMSRLRIAENNSTPIDVLERLLKDNDISVVKASQIALAKREKNNG